MQQWPQQEPAPDSSSSSDSECDEAYAYRLPPNRAYGGVKLSYVPNDRRAAAARSSHGGANGSVRSAPGGGGSVRSNRRHTLDGGHAAAAMRGAASSSSSSAAAARSPYLGDWSHETSLLDYARPTPHRHGGAKADPRQKSCIIS